MCLSSWCLEQSAAPLPSLHARLLGWASGVSLCGRLSKVTGPLSAAGPDDLWGQNPALSLSLSQLCLPASWADALVLFPGFLLETCCLQRR